MRSRSSAFIASLVAVALVACSDPQAPRPSVTEDEITLDLAASAGEAIATDIGLLIGGELDGMTFTGPSAELTGPRGPGGCEREADGRRRCAGGVEGSLTHERTFSFYDAAGTLQANFDALTTASINMQMTVSGTVTRERSTATVLRERDVTLSGLAGEETERIWNGTGAGSHNSVHSGERGTRTQEMSSNDTTTNVVFALPREENRWPKSGTIVNNMSATITFTGARSETKNISRRAMVTFNGTSVVPLQVGTKSCTLNLETRQVTCASGS